MQRRVIEIHSGWQISCSAQSPLPGEGSQLKVSESSGFLHQVFLTGLSQTRESSSGVKAYAAATIVGATTLSLPRQQV